MNEFDRCIDEWAELVAQRNATITALEQRVKELETNLFGATATVASLEAKLVEVERERLSWEKLAGSFTHSQHQYLREMEQLRVEIASVKQSRDWLREVLRRIANYDQGSGCCAYGCDMSFIVI